jgi:hypothetical protein
MLRKAVFFRIMALPVCLISGALEFLALQRSRILARRGYF